MPPNHDAEVEGEELIGRLLASGRYATRSEVIRAGLRLLAEHEADLEQRRAAIFASIDEAIRDIENGNGVPAEEVFAMMEAIIDEAEAKRDAAE